MTALFAGGALVGFLALVFALEVLFGPSGPRAVSGVWRRTADGRPVCPPCAEVRAGDCLPLQPLDETEPVEAFEKCCQCTAYRAEEGGAG